MGQYFVLLAEFECTYGRNMINSFSSLCDDFYVDMHINTELDLPSERDTILSFFERIERQFPGMGNFRRRENGDFCLEEDRQGQRYRWVTLEVDRICAGCADPKEFEDAYSLQRLVLELSPYMLGVSHLDIDSLDVTFTMDFDYEGNHDEVVSEALYGNSAFSSLLDLEGVKPLGFSPTTIVALDEDCYSQARIAIESRTSVYEVRNKKYKSDSPISLYFTMRQYPNPQMRFDALKSFGIQCGAAEQFMADKIVPNFANPLLSAIAQRR